MLKYIILYFLLSPLFVYLVADEQKKDNTLDSSLYVDEYVAIFLLWGPFLLLQLIYLPYWLVTKLNEKIINYVNNKPTKKQKYLKTLNKLIKK